VIGSGGDGDVLGLPCRAQVFVLGRAGLAGQEFEDFPGDGSFELAQDLHSGVSLEQLTLRVVLGRLMVGHAHQRDAEQSVVRGAVPTTVVEDTRNGVAALAPSTDTPAGKQQLVTHLQGQLQRAKTLLQVSEQRNAAMAQMIRSASMGYRGAAGMGGGMPGMGGGMPTGMSPGGGAGGMGGAAPLTMHPESQGPHSGDDDEPYVVDDPEVLSALTAPFNELILGGGWTWAQRTGRAISRRRVES
jgi:hypothetical protein